MAQVKRTDSTEDIKARPLNLPELVDYQSGAVVSRTIIKRKKGTVTLFAFDADEELSEHACPHDAMLSVVDGETEVTIADTPHRLTAGQTIILPADIPHAVRAITPFKMTLVMIRE